MFPLFCSCGQVLFDLGPFSPEQRSAASTEVTFALHCYHVGMEDTGVDALVIQETPTCLDVQYPWSPGVTL